MQALLEFRLSDRWAPLLATEAAALLVAAILVFQGVVPFDQPSRVVLVVSLFVLGAAWFDTRRAEMADRTDKREALHATLPASRLAQAVARAVEPVCPLATTALVVSAAFLALGRGALFTTGPWRDDLLLVLGAASWLLVLETSQVTMQEGQLVLRRLGHGWIFWIVTAVVFGGPGAWLGYLLGDGAAMPYIFYLAVGRPGSIALALVLAFLLATLGVLRYRHRDANLGGC